MNQKNLMWVLVVLVVVLAGTTIFFAAQKYAYAPSTDQPVPAQSENLAGKIPAATSPTATQGQAATNS